jgi:G:T-mismatch repair DNA endonuclease (very short patch repair protein)
MSSVKSKDTSPELIVRRIVHSLGFRYRQHSATLLMTLCLRRFAAGDEVGGD